MQPTLRKGHIWTASKLDFLEAYLPAFQKACKQWWRGEHASTYYIDGFAGPGRNIISGESRPGSPLIAAGIRPPFRRYFMVEGKRKNFAQLQTELATPEFEPVAQRVDARHGDFNVEVDGILHAIRDQAPAFFFLDPEGLELEWRTVEKIARRGRVDLFILISGMGVVRCASPRSEITHDAVTRFYGHERWRDVFNDDASDLQSAKGQKRFELAVEMYLEGLRGLGYTHVDQFLIATNSRNADLHALVFASKNGVAIKIATSQIKKLIRERKGQQQSLF